MATAATPLSTWVCALENENGSSLTYLQERMGKFIEKHGKECRLAIGIAGGGGHFSSTLASTPGSSSILLQSSILYDREATRRFVKKDLSDPFKYASSESASYIAEAALEQALILAAAADPRFGHFPTENLWNAVGMAIASVLRSGPGSSRSRGYFCIRMSDSCTVAMSIRLAPKGGDGERAVNRSRFEEDVFLAHCALTCLEYSLLVRREPVTGSSETEDGTTITVQEKIQTRSGDDIEVIATVPTQQQRTNEGVLGQAADLILQNKCDTVQLLAEEVSQHPGRPNFQIVNKTVLPPLSIVFPGSFNPPHEGHVKLGNAALKVAEKEIVWFEISFKNADKAAVDREGVVDRLKHFLDDRVRAEMPRHWGILLTNTPLFTQKADLLYPLQVSHDYSNDGKEILPPVYFVIGSDTFVRIIDPKYYDNSQEKMLEVLQSMPCAFLVGGRLEQRKNQDGTDGEVAFVTGEEELQNLPESLRSKFILIPDFRFDISSSQIRAGK